MAEMIAAGELPLWVRFAVRQGSRRKTALSQTIVLLSMGIVLLVTGGASLVETGGDSVLGWLALCCGLASAGMGLWAWRAIRWVDRNGKWVQPAEQDAAADRPRE